MKMLWKGNLLDENEIEVNIHDRGYQFGDGIYEFVRVYNGNLFYLQEHLDRLKYSADLIDMKLPYTLDEIADFCKQLVKENNIISGNVYFQITRGDGIPRRHDYPLYEDQKGVISGFTNSFDRPTERIENGTSAITYPDLRWNLCNAKTLNLLPNCMAISEAKKQGANKAILVKDGYVTEERAGNVFIVKNGVVYTHPDGPEILPGITKIIVLKLLNAINVEVVEKKFTVEDMMTADEVIVTDTKSEICPIIKIDDKIIGTGKRGKVTEKLDDLYKEEIVRLCGKVT